MLICLENVATIQLTIDFNTDVMYPLVEMFHYNQMLTLPCFFEVFPHSLQDSYGEKSLLLYQSQLLTYILIQKAIKAELSADLKECIADATDKKKRSRKEEDWIFSPSKKLV